MAWLDISRALRPQELDVVVVVRDEVYPIPRVDAFPWFGLWLGTFHHLETRGSLFWDGLGCDPRDVEWSEWSGSSSRPVFNCRSCQPVCHDAPDGRFTRAEGSRQLAQQLAHDHKLLRHNLPLLEVGGDLEI